MDFVVQLHTLSDLNKDAKARLRDAVTKMPWYMRVTVPSLLPGGKSQIAYVPRYMQCEDTEERDSLPINDVLSW